MMRRRAPAVPEAASLADMMPVGASQPALLELRGVGKRFRAASVETVALADIDLAIGRGELSRSAAVGLGQVDPARDPRLLEAPSNGEYRIDGIDTATLRASALAELRNKTIGFVFQCST